MGMSTHAVGFRPPDKQWKKMKRIWEDCEEAGVSIPKEVEKFFQGESPGDAPGMEIDLGEAVTRYNAEMCDGYEIDVTKLPEGVKIIRVYNSY